ncbi:hypothetical protein ACIQYM_40035, partial [Rhodococcus erythropolis]
MTNETRRLTVRHLEAILGGYVGERCLANLARHCVEVDAGPDAPRLIGGVRLHCALPDYRAGS